MVRLSSGLIGAVLGTYGLKGVMQYGTVEVYSLTPPESPNEPPSGTKLAVVTNDGGPFQTGGMNGLNIRQLADGSLADDGHWFLTGVADGTPGWWRWKWASYDSDAASVYFPRVDGSVGSPSDPLVLPVAAIYNGLVTKIDSFSLSLGAC